LQPNRPNLAKHLTVGQPDHGASAKCSGLEAESQAVTQVSQNGDDNVGSGPRAAAAARTPFLRLSEEAVLRILESALDTSVSSEGRRLGASAVDCADRDHRNADSNAQGSTGTSNATECAIFALNGSIGSGRSERRSRCQHRQYLSPEQRRHRRGEQAAAADSISKGSIWDKSGPGKRSAGKGSSRKRSSRKGSAKAGHSRKGCNSGDSEGAEARNFEVIAQY
jgi:hypothetical protein